MMSFLEWKNVEIFDLVALSSIQLNVQNTEITAQCCNLIKSENGKPNIKFVLCSKSGMVYVFMENGVKSRQISLKCPDGHQPIKLCCITTTNILAVLSQNDNYAICICIYDLNQTKKEEHPLCLSTINLLATSIATVFEISFIGIEKLFALGVGFEKGDILLYFGSINRDLSLNMRRHTIASSPINGIQFSICDQQNEMKACNVFVTSVDVIYCIQLNDKNIIDSKMVLDSNHNMANQCCTLSQPAVSDSFLVVGRDDAIYCFRRDCRGPCYAFEGHKQFLSWIDNYLLVVVKTNFGSAITVVDIDNKLILLHKRISTVIDCVSSNKLYYFITKDDNSKNVCKFNVHELKEYPTNIKVKTLIAKCMHNNALMMLKKDESQYQYDNAILRLKYGNNLLLKGFYARAVTEYAQTIGILKPYQIISKLLSSRHNDNLIQYVKKLLESKITTFDHQKLLDICSDRQRLRSRIGELWIIRNDTTHIIDFKQISNRSINLSDVNHTVNNFQGVDFHNADEEDIFNFFLEYGREVLSVDSTIVLNTLKSLVKSHKIKNILRFLMIFPDYSELNVNLLSYYIENYSPGDEKLLYYLFSLHLGLWQENKISAEDITNLVKKMPIRFEKILTLSKTYLFAIGIENCKTSEESENISEDDKSFLRCLDQHIKKNPNLASLLTIGPRSLLTILQKVCAGSDIKIKDCKPFLSEKFMKNIMDAKCELGSIGDLNCEIAIHNSLESHYKLNPIEFRNKYCDVCRQSLHMPSIYYLCQHSFHKDCVRTNYDTKIYDDVGCGLCGTVLEYPKLDDEQLDLITKSCDIMKGVSSIFATGIHSL
ncbi:vacuolar protein sorting-associated protein 11 homolog [Drosophila mojavensis]|uniref:RING-type domain-containing protein n=1 Tax=Drosophila mojavensis TaxID=7230 RepID=B4KAU2_DROMO|nr:vacuolar protein sorting-associated protein 11 homolog [Drosophila mojavensis]EDW13615.1 uncharacterized protein Dmoj_GI23791 [Drosophila mojavensis]